MLLINYKNSDILPPIKCPAYFASSPFYQYWRLLTFNMTRCQASSDFLAQALMRFIHFVKGKYYKD